MDKWNCNFPPNQLMKTKSKHKRSLFATLISRATYQHRRANNANYTRRPTTDDGTRSGRLNVRPGGTFDFCQRVSLWPSCCRSGVITNYWLKRQRPTDDRFSPGLPQKTDSEVGEERVQSTISVPGLECDSKWTLTEQRSYRQHFYFEWRSRVESFIFS